ncbi:hypothetical protein FUU19_19730 [Serratia sp. Lou2A]|uniref:Uncharacterized protein n=1 Tax=Serratia montpellierensis TaxID=2598730 RepID=A0ABS8J9T2_9GAMM|nr:hypothetical protein [Serratia sp. Lou2A]MCC7660788.1 hypothetical protein [Serratia sp. Pon4B]
MSVIFKVLFRPALSKPNPSLVDPLHDSGLFWTDQFLWLADILTLVAVFYHRCHPACAAENWSANLAQVARQLSYPFWR